MVKQFLKIAGVKNQSDFYKKYPTEAAFFKAHPEARQLVHQKMSYGGGIYAYQDGGEPISSDYPDYRTFKAAHDAWEASQGMPDVPADVYSMPAADASGLPDYLKAQAAQASSTGSAAPAGARQSFTLNPYEGVSVQDMLTAQGKAGDYNSRKQLAKTLGMQGYRGRADQNKQMMEMIRQNPDVLTDYVQSTIPAPKTKRTSAAPRDEKALREFMMQEAQRQAAANPYIMAPQPSSPQKSKGLVESLPALGKGSAKKYAKKSDEYIDQDPYFFADEGDNAFIKAIDAPFTWARNQGAKIALDRDLGTAAKIIAMGAGAGLLGKAYDYFKPRYEPYNPKQLPGAGPIRGQKALPPSQKALPPSSPRGWTMGEGSYRSPNFPFHQAGGSYNPTSVDYGQGLPMFDMGAAFPQAMYGMGMAEGGQMPQWLAERRFAAAGNQNMMKDYGYAQGGIVKGGEYDMTEDEIQDLINKGYKIEYI